MKLGVKILAFALFFPAAHSLVAQESIVVSNVKITASKESYSGSCPVSIEFTARFDASVPAGMTKLEYTWHHWVQDPSAPPARIVPNDPNDVKGEISPSQTSFELKDTITINKSGSYGVNDGLSLKGFKPGPGTTMGQFRSLVGSFGRIIPVTCK